MTQNQFINNEKRKTLFIINASFSSLYKKREPVTETCIKLIDPDL